MTKEDKKNMLNTLLSQFKSEKNIEKRVDLLAKIADTIRNIDPQTAIKYAFQGLEIGERCGFKEGICKCITTIGIIFGLQGKYLKALDSFEQVLKMAAALNNKDIIARNLNNCGIIHRSIGNFSKATELFFEALKINEECENNALFATNLHNIADTFSAQGDHAGAIEYYKKAITIKKKCNNNPGVAFSYISIGATYCKMSENSKAMQYLRKALNMFQKVGDQQGIALTLNNIGVAFTHMKKFRLAIQYYETSLELHKKLNNEDKIAAIYINIGSLKRELNEFRSAIKHIKKGLGLAIKVEDLNIQKSAYHTLAFIYEKLGDATRALENLKMYDTINDRLTCAIITSQASKIEAKYEIKKKEREAEIWKLASITDMLTGLLNRRGMIEKIQNEINNAEKHRTHFSLAILDIDHFKQFNDLYGHDCGDSVLVAISKALQNSMRKCDSIGRWGGEEFIMIFPKTNAESGFKLTEKIRRKIERFEHKYKNRKHKITLSIGVAMYKRSKDFDRCIKEADDALYAAKESGRNRCVVSKK